MVFFAASGQLLARQAAALGQARMEPLQKISFPSAPTPATSTQELHSLQDNEFLCKILNSKQKYFYTDRQPWKFKYRFGGEFIPNDVSLMELVQDIRKGDLIWIPISVAWTSTLAHWKYDYKSKIFPLYVFGGLMTGIFCLFSNAYARIGGFEEHERKYGSEAYFRKLKEQQETAL